MLDLSLDVEPIYICCCFLFAIESLDLISEGDFQNNFFQMRFSQMEMREFELRQY